MCGMQAILTAVLQDGRVTREEFVMACADDQSLIQLLTPQTGWVPRISFRLAWLVCRMHTIAFPFLGILNDLSIIFSFSTFEKRKELLSSQRFMNNELDLPDILLKNLPPILQ